MSAGKGSRTQEADGLDVVLLGFSPLFLSFLYRSWHGLCFVVTRLEGVVRMMS